MRTMTAWPAREIAENETVRRAERRANFVASYLKYDLDGDGRVTKAEMLSERRSSSNDSHKSSI